MKYWIATKKGEITRVAKYCSSLSELHKNGYIISQGKRPKKHIFITMKYK